MAHWWKTFNLGRFVQGLVTKSAEKFAERYYEGPKPPARIRERVQMFRLLKPEASHDDWADFATKLAENCYTEAFTRGYEWQARQWPLAGDKTPEQRKEEEDTLMPAFGDPTWRRRLETGQDERHPLAHYSPEQRRNIIAAVEQMAAGSQPVALVLHANPGLRVMDGR